MIRTLATLAVAFVLAVPATSQAISIVLTATGEDPALDGVSEITTRGTHHFALHMDIGGLPGDVPNQAFADSLSFGTVFAFQFSFQVDPATTQYVGFPSTCNGMVACDNLGWNSQPAEPDPPFDIVPFWQSQTVFLDNVTGIVGVNDFNFSTTFSAAIPGDLLTGFLSPGTYYQMGVLSIDLGPNVLGGPVISLIDSSDTVVLGATGKSLPGNVVLLTFVPEPSPALLLFLSLIGLALVRRRESQARGSPLLDPSNAKTGRFWRTHRQREPRPANVNRREGRAELTPLRPQIPGAARYVEAWADRG